MHAQKQINQSSAITRRTQLKSLVGGGRRISSLLLSYSGLFTGTRSRGPGLGDPRMFKLLIMSIMSCLPVSTPRAAPPV